MTPSMSKWRYNLRWEGKVYHPAIVEGYCQRLRCQWMDGMSKDGGARNPIRAGFRTSWVVRWVDLYSGTKHYFLYPPHTKYSY